MTPGELIHELSEGRAPFEQTGGLSEDQCAFLREYLRDERVRHSCRLVAQYLGSVEDGPPDDWRVLTVPAIASDVENLQGAGLAAFTVTSYHLWLEMLLHDRTPNTQSTYGVTRYTPIDYAMSRLVNRRRMRFGHFGDNDLCALLLTISRLAPSPYSGLIDWRLPGPVLRRRWEAGGIPAPLQSSVEHLYESCAPRCTEDLAWRQIERELRRMVSPESVVLPIDPGDTWGAHVIQWCRREPLDVQRSMERLLNHAAAVKGSSPRKTWLAGANGAIVELGTDVFRSLMLNWSPLLGAKREEHRAPLRAGRDRTVWSRENVLVFRGLVWMLDRFKDDEVAGALASLCEAGFALVSGYGARAPLIGNAAVWVLARRDPERSGPLLTRALRRVRFKPGIRLIERALREAADRQGITPAQLEERCVPTYGVTLDPGQRRGVREVMFGSCAARLIVSGSSGATLTWTNAKGRAVKSPPAAVKSQHSEAAEELKHALVESRKTLAAQRARIERFMLDDPEWSLEDWRQYYADHPLLAELCSRLIWEFRGVDGSRDPVTGMPRPEGLTGADGEPVRPPVDARVRLWHPLGKSIEEVRGWRRFVEERCIRQPFKQAHREVYLLTDAERSTGTYSNRFAAHILLQHIMNGLCRERGWNVARAMIHDSMSEANPSVRLPAHALRADFLIAGAEGPGTDIIGAGSYSHVSTDQVRFFRLDEREPLPLEQVPPRVFSEVMRDVDLFVGVASVGNNPQWLDRGPQPEHRDYWNRFAFGELGPSGEVRRELLGRLIPRLAIADRCEIDGRFVRVSGKRRTYRVHLGSGSIQMEPNSEYLCIVPQPTITKPQDRVFVPFEGDNTVAVIISKLILLANDDTITDPVILRQIEKQ